MEYSMALVIKMLKLFRVDKIIIIFKHRELIKIVNVMFIGKTLR